MAYPPATAEKKKDGWGYAQKMWMKVCIVCSTQAPSQGRRGLPEIA